MAYNGHVNLPRVYRNQIRYQPDIFIKPQCVYPSTKQQVVRCVVQLPAQRAELSTVHKQKQKPMRNWGVCSIECSDNLAEGEYKRGCVFMQEPGE